MPETSADRTIQATSHIDTKTAIKYFVWGAVPAAVAFIAVLWQALDRYVPLAHQGILVGIAVYLGNVSLAVWLWCAVQVVRRQFAARDRLADARVTRLQQEVYVIEETLSQRHEQLLDALEKLCRSVRGLHKHNAQADEQTQQIIEETDHLRNLILGADAPTLPNQQQLGPRRMN